MHSSISYRCLTGKAVTCGWCLHVCFNVLLLTLHGCGIFFPSRSCSRRRFKCLFLESTYDTWFSYFKVTCGRCLPLPRWRCSAPARSYRWICSSRSSSWRAHCATSEINPATPSPLTFNSSPTWFFFIHAYRVVKEKFSEYTRLLLPMHIKLRLKKKHIMGCYTWSMRHTIVEGFAFSLTTWRPLTCAEIFTHGRFRFSPPSEKWQLQSGSNPCFYAQQHNALATEPLRCVIWARWLQK